VANWTREEGRESLAAISTLKRAIGIPNHPSKTDEISVGGRCHIYTQDEESAELIAELLYKWANAGRKKYYDLHLPDSTLRDTIAVQSLPEGGFQTTISVLSAPNFTKGLHRLTQKHISPDKGFTR
jgi:hypothetical protein